MGRKVILCISDLQIPFEHQDAFDFIQHIEKTLVKKDDQLTIVNLGDEFDQATLRGKSPPDPNGLSTGGELLWSIEKAQPWYKAYPKMKICNSNHSTRAYKRAFEVGLASEFMRKLGEVYQAPPGWVWADRWVLDGIVFEHGENVSGTDAALKAAIQNRMSTVIGHQHSHGGVIHSGSFHNTIWGMNTGCLIDIDAYAFNYAKGYRKKPTLGTGIIIDRVPLFLPMVLNHRKRWVRRLV